MKANLQSNVMSLDIGSAGGMYGNTSNFIYASWNKMPDYALEYVVERDRASSRLKDQAGTAFSLSPPATAAVTDTAGSATIAGTTSSQQIDAVLTPRQRDVFELIVQGMSNKEIARELSIAEGTSKIHTAALLRALGARNRTEAAFMAAKLVGTRGQLTARLKSKRFVMSGLNGSGLSHDRAPGGTRWKAYSFRKLSN